jgi:hypothetical protein
VSQIDGTATPPASAPGANSATEHRTPGVAVCPLQWFPRLPPATAACLTGRSSGPPPARHLGREALEAYHAPRGPSSLPVASAQLKR